MRKFILITALLLASASAQANPVMVASNDEPTSVDKIEPAKPEAAKAEIKPAAPEIARTETPKPDVTEPKPAPKAHVRSYDSDEARARKIAARYGISW
jgi:hypothetical protein